MFSINIISVIFLNSFFCIPFKYAFNRGSRKISKLRNMAQTIKQLGHPWHRMCTIVSLPLRYLLHKGFISFPILCRWPYRPRWPLSLANWCDTQSKWPLARNLDRSWWYLHIRLKFFGCDPWTARFFTSSTGVARIIQCPI